MIPKAGAPGIRHGRTIRPIRSVASLLIGALGFVSCGRPPAADVASDGMVRLRVVTAPWLAFAPLHVAQAEGYFAQQGIEVEFVPMTGTEVAVPLLVNGSVDVLPGPVSPGLLNAIARGAPIRLVGKVQDAVSGGCSSIAIVARPGLLQESGGRPVPSQVRRASLNRQAVMLYLADVAFESVGLDMDSMEVVDVPNASEQEALATGAVDAALAGEPFLTRTLEAGTADLWVPVLDAMPDAEISLLFFGRRLIEDDSAAGTRFMVAYLQALRQLAEGKTERNLELIAQATGDDTELLRRACLPFGPTDGRVRMESVMKFQEWAESRGLIDHAVQADRLWDPRFVERANRVLDGMTHR